MNQDSSYLVSRGRVKVVIKASGGENGGGKDVAYTYSVVVFFYYFVSVSRLQKKESGSHHKFRRYG